MTKQQQLAIRKELKENFIAQFTSNFLSSWAAVNYKADHLYKHMPIEDAKHLAEETWELLYGKDEDFNAKIKTR